MNHRFGQRQPHSYPPSIYMRLLHLSFYFLSGIVSVGTTLAEAPQESPVVAPAICNGYLGPYGPLGEIGLGRGEEMEPNFPPGWAIVGTQNDSLSVRGD